MFCFGLGCITCHWEASQQQESENQKLFHDTYFYGSYFSKAKPFNISSDIIKYYDFEDLEMNILGEVVYNSIYDFSKINSRDKYSMFIRGNNALTIINNKNLKNWLKLNKKGSCILVQFPLIY